jgi:hypothetical protein
MGAKKPVAVDLLAMIYSICIDVLWFQLSRRHQPP